MYLGLYRHSGEKDLGELSWYAILNVYSHTSSEKTAAHDSTEDNKWSVRLRHPWTCNVCCFLAHFIMCPFSVISCGCDTTAAGSGSPCVELSRLKGVEGSKFVDGITSDSSFGSLDLYI